MTGQRTLPRATSGALDTELDVSCLPSPCQAGTVHRDRPPRGEIMSFVTPGAGACRCIGPTASNATGPVAEGPAELVLATRLAGRPLGVHQ